MPRRVSDGLRTVTMPPQACWPSENGALKGNSCLTFAMTRTIWSAQLRADGVAVDRAVSR
jgi:hypothetical protein